MVKLSDLIREEEMKASKEGNAISLPSLQENDVDSEAARIYKEVCQFVEKVMDNAKGKRPFDPNHGMKSIERIVQSYQLLESLYERAVELQYLRDFFIHHSVNTAIFSIKMGVTLNYDQDQLIKLGTTALFHEIGITRVPEVILYKKSPLTENEFQVLKKHPRYGYETVLLQGREFEWMAEIIYQEHERERGQGYPRGLKGDEIQEFAKIIGIVDIYEALINSRPHRKRFHPYAGVKMIVEKQKGFFSPRIIKALLSQVSVFPLNCYVKLNNHMIGKVIKTNARQLLRPKVEICYDGKGKKLKEVKVINLSDSPLLYIADPLYEEELPK